MIGEKTRLVAVLTDARPVGLREGFRKGNVLFVSKNLLELFSSEYMRSLYRRNRKRFLRKVREFALRGEMAVLEKVLVSKEDLERIRSLTGRKE